MNFFNNCKMNQTEYTFDNKNMIKIIQYLNLNEKNSKFKK